MKADGTAKRRLTTRAASGPSWSPDGTADRLRLAVLLRRPGRLPDLDDRGRRAARRSCSRATAAARRCRPSPPSPPARRAALSDRLRTDDAVAWSPDGTRVAFRGGNCESIYDACLSVGTVATGGETTVAAYGGGSLQNSGFAVVPSWRSDGAKLTWTAFQQGETAADDQPVHLVEYDAITGAKRIVGGALDREMAYVDATRGVATGQYKGGSWVLVVSLANGARTPFHQGSQPSVQPVR